MKKYALHGLFAGIILLTIAVFVVIYIEWGKFDGRCIKMGFPFLAEAQEYDCTFTEYIKDDSRSIFWLWPYDPRLWVAIISILVIPVVAGSILGFRKKST